MNCIMKVLRAWVKVPSAMGLRSMASSTRHLTRGRRLFSIISNMTGERSAAKIGIVGNRLWRAVVTTPLPAPLSKAVAPGAEIEDSSWTHDSNSSAHGRVTYTALAAYAAEVVPQSSVDSGADMNLRLSQ